MEGSRIALQSSQVVLEKHYTMYKMDVIRLEFTVGTLHNYIFFTKNEGSLVY